MALTNRLPPLFSILLLLLLLLIFSPNDEFVRFTKAGKGRVHITDDLDDVIDNEEDEHWKEWGKKAPHGPDEFDPPKLDYEKMNLAQLQEEMLSKQYGTVIGFVKLQLGVTRTLEMVADIVTKWSKILKTGTIDVNFVGIDMNTIMFTLMRGQDILELREFLLSQSEAYEVKINDQVFTRPGDPTTDELAHMEYMEKMKNKERPKEEL